MLDAAGVAYRAVSPQVDEAVVKAKLHGAAEIASELARAKAASIDHPGWVIGSDSVVTVGGRLFDKPRDREEAAAHLRFFSGKPMDLTSAVALSQARTFDWCHAETTLLYVRPLSDAFIESYLDSEWPEVGYCVGVFRMEGRGVQLFESIQGDHFTVLGMPLLPVLGALRQLGELPQ